VARASLLASIKSPLVNTAGNTVMGAATAAARRIQAKRFSGYNKDVSKRYSDLTFRIYKASGYDISRMDKISDDQKLLGEDITSSQGEGSFRSFSRLLEKTVFKIGLGYMDVKFSAAHFGDTSNLVSSSMAFQEGKGDYKTRAKELMLDSMNIEPRTNEGKMLRDQATKESFYGTFTNDSVASEISLGIRKVLNTATGDLRVGDQTIPFAKTPANVVAAALEHSGVLFPLDMFRMAKGVKSGNEVLLKKGFTGLVRSGVGLAGAFMLTALIDPEDYVSEYADYYPKERQLIEAEGAAYNSIKIGDKWVSLDYFGPFGAALVGIMTAKKHGDGVPDAISKYYTAALRQTLKIPGINEIRESVETFSNITKKVKEDKGEEALMVATEGFADFVAPRVIPAIMYDIAVTLDDYKRRTDTVLSKFLNRIPLARGVLPEKIGMFGKPVKNQPGLNPLLFGSRVKVSERGLVVDELNRLSMSGQLPSISSIEYSSQRIKVLKEVIGTEEFNSLMRDFGTKLYEIWDKLISKSAYKKLSNEKQRQLLDKAKNKILDGVYGKYLNKHKDDMKQYMRDNK